jgi:hypothetical protein
MPGVLRITDLSSWFCILLFVSGPRIARFELVQVAPGTNVGSQPSSSAPTFYRDVLPIIKRHCQRCHNPSGMAPMPFDTYDEVRGYANVIRNVTQDKAMPPPFALPEAGRVREDLSLSPEEISTITAWANAKAPAGNAAEAASSSGSREAFRPEVVVKPTKATPIHSPDGDYLYEIAQTHFKGNRWVQSAEFFTGQPKDLRQAVVFIRPRGSSWLRYAPVGTPFSATKLAKGEPNDPTQRDILVVYAAGSAPATWPASMAKLIPSGADLIFRLQYVPGINVEADQSGVRLTLRKHRPPLRVMTLELKKTNISIPWETSDYRVEARATLALDAVLLGFFPDMHQLGTRFEYGITDEVDNNKNGLCAGHEVLLRVNFDLRWQSSYTLAEPCILKAGTTLQAVAWYDNSASNPRNPNPGVPVYLGDNYGDEASVGFFEVAIPAGRNRRELLIH